MSQPAITPWYDRPTALPLEFLFSKTYVEKLEIIHKEEGLSTLMNSGPNANIGSGYPMPVSFIFLITPFGDLRLEVSSSLYEVLQVGDKIVINYTHGRWSGALEGKIAR